jgi:hypothetical protein
MMRNAFGPSVPDDFLKAQYKAIASATDSSSTGVEATETEDENVEHDTDQELEPRPATHTSPLNHTETVPRSIPNPDPSIAHILTQPQKK